MAVGWSPLPRSIDPATPSSWPGVTAAALIVSLLLIGCGKDPVGGGGSHQGARTSGIVFNGGEVRPLATGPDSRPTERWRVRAEQAAPHSVGEMLFMSELAGGDWRLVRLDAESGQALWTASLDPANDGAGWIALVDGTLVVGAGEEEAAVVGLDPESGERHWHLRGGLNAVGRTHVAVFVDYSAISVVEAKTGTSKLRVAGSSARFSDDDGTVYLGSARSLVAKRLDGAERWKVDAAPRSMTLFRETIVFSEEVEHGRAVRVRSLGAADGRERWSRDDELSVNIIPTRDGRLLTMSRMGSELLDPVSGASLATVGVKARDGWLLDSGATEHVIATERGVTTQAGSTDRIEVIDLAEPAAVDWSAAGSGASPGCLAVHGLLLTSETLPDPPTGTNLQVHGGKIRIVARRLSDGEPQWEVTAPSGLCAVAGGTLVLEEDDGLVGYRS